MGLPAFSFGRPRRCLFSGRVHGHLWSHWRWGTSWICDMLWPSHRVNSSLAPACIASDQTREHIVHPLGERQESGGNGQWVMTCCGFQGTIRDQIQHLRIDQVEWHGPIHKALWIFVDLCGLFIFFQVDVILKLYGFNGNFDVDRLMSGSQIWAELSSTQLLRTMCREAAQRCETEDMEETLQCFDEMIFDVSIPKGHIPFKLCHISRWDVEECEEHDWLLGWRGLIPSSSDWLLELWSPGTCSWVNICWHWMESNWDSINSCWFLFQLRSFFDEIFAYANKPVTLIGGFPALFDCRTHWRPLLRLLSAWIWLLPWSSIGCSRWILNVRQDLQPAHKKKHTERACLSTRKHPPVLMQRSMPPTSGARASLLACVFGWPA